MRKKERERASSSLENCFIRSGRFIPRTKKLLFPRPRLYAFFFCMKTDRQTDRQSIGLERKRRSAAAGQNLTADCALNKQTKTIANEKSSD